MYHIYVPNGQRSPSLLEKLGIGDLMRDGDAGLMYNEILEHGPDEGAGLLIAIGEKPPDYKPGERDWQVCCPDKVRGLPAGRFWWGFPKSGLTPEGLARTGQRGGMLWPFADGQKWLLPNFMALPYRFVLDQVTGGEAREVKPEWKALYDRMTWAYGVCKLIIEEERKATDEEAQDLRLYIAEMLGLNYRINVELIRRLKMLDGDGWFKVACHTGDFETLYRIVDELQKKSDASTPPGSTPAAGSAG